MWSHHASLASRAASEWASASVENQGFSAPSVRSDRTQLCSFNLKNTSRRVSLENENFHIKYESPPEGVPVSTRRRRLRRVRCRQVVQTLEIVPHQQFVAEQSSHSHRPLDRLVLNLPSCRIFFWCACGRVCGRAGGACQYIYIYSSSLCCIVSIDAVSDIKPRWVA